MSVPEKYKEHLLRQGFHLIEKINSGLSGAVYLAVQESLNRHVAIKFFDSSIATRDSNLRKRFIREPIILAKLQHPSIPYVLTSGKVAKNGSEVPYTGMQYISGNTFEDVVKKRESIPRTTLLGYVKQILAALSVVHNESIIHRDIKPANLMVVGRGHCYLIDFSIGVSLGDETGLTRTTLPGSHLGTFEYMSPEQKKDMSSVDARSDIYSVGIVLLEMLTGSTNVTDIHRSLNDEPHWIRQIVVKACSQDPIDRFQNADEFSRAIAIPSVTQGADKIEPSLAFCSNFKCPDADWSPNKYFRGPLVIEKSTNSYCTTCGGQLKYQCAGCGSPFSKEPFCGNCGTQHYVIPTCLKCGSLLEEQNIGTDTESLGCGKCQRAAVKATEQVRASSATDFDDDIPF